MRIRDGAREEMGKRGASGTYWNAQELEVLDRLSSPSDIQDFLDSIPYSPDPFYRSPRSVLRDRRAHCFDGALFAACALRRIGFPPLIVDITAERDDDHLLAIFKVAGHLGAIAKSNFVGLRFRDPVFRSLRELVMSYYDAYFNLARERSIRGVTMPLNLRRFDKIRWDTEDSGLEAIAVELDRIRKYTLFSDEMIAGMRLVDDRTFTAQLFGSDPKGLYQPGSREVAKSDAANEG